MIGRLLRLLAPALLLALAVLGFAAAPASAHAVLVDSSPRDGVRLDRSPTQVLLRFDEPVQVVPDGIRVLSAEGDRADAGAARLAAGGRSVVIPLRAGLRDGRNSYLVSWRVVSADSHVVSGSLRFGVGQNPAAAPQSSTGKDPLAVLAGVGTGLGYAGLVGAVGCPAVALLVWPSALRSRRTAGPVVGGTVLLLIGTAVQFLASGPQATGSGWAGLLRADGLTDTVRSQSGGLLLVRLVLGLTALALVLEVLARARAARPTRGLDAGSWLTWVWALVAAGLVVDVAARGHAMAGESRRLALLATVAHLIGMCGWLGGLVLIGLIILPRLGRSAPAAARVIGPWSRFAFGSVVLVIISGEYLGWRQVQPVESLWTTRYGAVLLIKLGLVVLALLAGRTAAGLAGRTGLLRRIRRAPTIRTVVAVETAITAAILAAATVLSATPPARDTYGPPQHAAIGYDRGRLQVAVDTTRRGPERMTVTSLDRAGNPLPLRSLSGRLSSIDAGVSAVDVHFAGAGARWRSTDATVPLPGLWTLQLTASPRTGPAYVMVVEYRVW